MPPLSSLIPKWPDIQIDAPLGSGGVRHGITPAPKARSPALKAAGPSGQCWWNFPLPPTPPDRGEEGIPFGGILCPHQGRKIREIDFLSTSSPHRPSTWVRRCGRGTRPQRAFYRSSMDLAQALTAFRVGPSDRHAGRVRRLRPQGHAGYLRRPARLPRKAGICHRDIKPANILCEATGDFYLEDFGVSQYTAAPDATLTSSGTARYAATSN